MTKSKSMMSLAVFAVALIAALSIALLAAPAKAALCLECEGSGDGSPEEPTYTGTTYKPKVEVELLRLKCVEQEDLSGADTVHFEVSDSKGNNRRIPHSGEWAMHDGVTADLSAFGRLGVRAGYNDVYLKLIETDFMWFDRDDNLGAAAIPKPGEIPGVAGYPSGTWWHSQGEFEAYFTEDDARYILYYRVWVQAP